jgi:hypothetical protein
LDRLPDDDEALAIENAWALEIERRCDALDAGTTGTTDRQYVRRYVETKIIRGRD